LVAALILAAPAYSQGTLVTPQQTNERIRELSVQAQSVQREYVIGSGDVLNVEVFDVPELTRDVRVSAAGTIALPLLPVRLHVDGLTEMQLEQKIAEVLEANGLVMRPQVSVVVKEKRSKPITVIGAVGRPMVYQAIRPVTLIEVLSEAGGIATDAGSTVIVRRPVRAVPAADPAADSAAVDPAGATPTEVLPAISQDAPATESTTPAQAVGTTTREHRDDSAPPDLAGESVVLTVNLNDLINTADPKYNIPLEGGDVVMVPRAGIVYVIGAVSRPGGFVLSNDQEQMSTLKLLSLAGGLLHTARSEHAVILRKDSTGQQKETQVDLKKILQRKTEDVALHPSDILFVPESGGKRAVIRATETALGIGTAATVFRLGQ
jgi:polysaccharide export outer membrane protein